MISSERECGEVLQQISAVKRAIDGVSKELVVESICKKMDAEESKKVEKMLAKAINL